MSMKDLRIARDNAKFQQENVAYGVTDIAGASTLADGDGDSPSTRTEDGEPRIAVLLVRSIDMRNGMLITILGDRVTASDPYRPAAAAVAKATVSVPVSKAPDTAVEDVKFLSRFAFTGKEGSSMLRVGVVPEGTVSVMDVRNRPLRQKTEYSRKEGYTWQKQGSI